MTPNFSTTLSRSVSAQLPPCSAAMSTITDPWAIATTAPDVMSCGAGLPGISAVEMTMSDCLACWAIIACSAARYASLISLA